MRIYSNSKIPGSALLAAATLCLIASLALAQGQNSRLSPEMSSKLEEITNEISSQVMSPYCPGRTLSSCPSPQARELRAKIFTWLSTGMSPEEVEQQLVSLYGSEVRGAPEADGVGLWAWIMPAVFVLILAGAIVLVLRRLRKNPDAASKEEGSVDAEYVEQVEEELKQRLV